MATLPPITPTKPKGRINNAPEPLTIDQSTYEIKGANTGTVYGSGTGDSNEAKLASALAIQNQLVTGGTPTVSGRPDLYAVTPTAAEGTPQAIQGADGKPIMPKVATSAQLGQAATGTLESFNKATGGVPSAPAPSIVPTAPSAPLPPTDYATAMRDALTAGAEAKKTELLGAPESYDNQILRQKGALMAKLFGENLTPDELKWLTPEQSNAILSGDEQLIKAQIAGLNTITQGRKEQRKEAQEQAEKQFDLFLASGAPVDQLPADFLNTLDSTVGLPAGTHASIYKSQVAQQEAEKEAASIEAAGKILDMLEKVPAGQEINIAGTTYTGFGTSGVQSGMEVDANGNGTIWSYNKLTREASTIDLGQISAGQGWELKTSSDGVRFLENKNTGERKLAQNGSDPNGGTNQGLVAAFPDNSVTPFDRKSKDGDQGFSSKWWAAQCGAWVNDTSGLGVGNSYQSKVDKMDPSITSENSQAGDVVIMRAGDTGHIAYINSKYTLNGELYYRLSESNWSKDENGVGLITHGRSVKASTITGYARPGFKNPAYSFGTDAGSDVDLYALDGGSSSATVEDVTALRTKFVAEAGAFTKIRDAYSKIQSVANNPSPAGDLSLIFNYMKILDPGSTVMQGEQATAQNIGNIPANIMSQYNKMLGSGESLSPEKRADFLAQAGRIYGTQYESFKPILDVYEQEAGFLGVEPSRIIGTVYVPPGTTAPVSTAQLKQANPQYSQIIDDLTREGYSASEIQEALR